MTLKFNSILEVVDVYVGAKFYQAKLFRFMSYHVHRENKTQLKTKLPLLPWSVVTNTVEYRLFSIGT